MSVKNFQLIESYPQADIKGKQSEREEISPWLFQKGKTTQDCFNVDYKAPLSMFQAFAICVSRFDAKMSGKLS